MSASTLSSLVSRDPRRLAGTRGAVHALLAREGAGDLADDVCLVATVLLAGVVARRADGPVQLTVSCAADHVRVEVADPEPPAGDPRTGHPAGGPGLHVVDALAAAWGVRYGEPFVVWALVDR